MIVGYADHARPQLRQERPTSPWHRVVILLDGSSKRVPQMFGNFLFQIHLHFLCDLVQKSY